MGEKPPANEGATVGAPKSGLLLDDGTVGAAPPNAKEGCAFEGAVPPKLGGAAPPKLGGAAPPKLGAA